MQEATIMKGKYELDSGQTEEEEVSERGHWGSKLEFILACLGNTWSGGMWMTFPYLCYVSGGFPVYFTAYVTMLGHVGFPMLLLEMTLGQYSSQGVSLVWRLCPLFWGVGVSIFLYVFVFVCVLSPSISLHGNYMYALLTSALISCSNSWNTVRCTEDIHQKRVGFLNGTTCRENGFTVSSDGYCNDSNLEGVGIHDEDTFQSQQKRYTPAILEYLQNYIMMEDSTDFDIAGSSSMKILFLAVFWLIIALCLCVGVKSYGKAVYFISSAIFILLFAFLIRAVTLPGARNGLNFLFNADYRQLLDPMVWFYAAMEVIYDLGLGFGGYLTLSSYNRFRNNYVSDAFIVVLVHVIVQLIVSVTVFGFLGYLAMSMDVAVSDVATSGMQLIFATIPEALLQLQGAKTWCFCFFFLVLLMRLGFVLTMVEVLSTSLCDLWRPFQRFRFILVAVLCGTLFLIGILFCTMGGSHAVTALDFTFHPYINLITICAMSACVTLFYSLCRLRHDFALMLGDRHICLFIITMALLFASVIHWFLLPISSIVCLGYAIKNYSEFFFFSSSYVIAGFTVLGVILLPMVLWPIIVFAIAAYRGSKCELVFQPNSKWGPQLSHFRKKATHLPHIRNDPSIPHLIELGAVRNDGFDLLTEI